jgi:two-component system response regulator CiaR
VLKKQIFDRVWGFASDTTPTVVDVYASNIRKTLQKRGYDKYIKTIRGLGYMLTDSGNADA